MASAGSFWKASEDKGKELNAFAMLYPRSSYRDPSLRRRFRLYSMWRVRPNNRPFQRRFGCVILVIPTWSILALSRVTVFGQQHWNKCAYKV